MTTTPTTTPTIHLVDGTVLPVSAADRAAFDALPPGHSTTSGAYVRALDTGLTWAVFRGDCGLRCYCAATGFPVSARLAAPATGREAAARLVKMLSR